MGGNACHSVDKVVSFIDDHRVVLGQDVDVGYRVNGEQGVIGDHHVGLSGLEPGQLGEALCAEWAPGGSQAFACRHADL
ncbi:Uncharacterised protein [Mycobacteroides abscessus subsp. abscessus]|nr:Uncharacterised protein [Mycobacteroides abscessus subsp. abscessus]